MCAYTTSFNIYTYMAFKSHDSFPRPRCSGQAGGGQPAGPAPPSRCLPTPRGPAPARAPSLPPFPSPRLRCGRRPRARIPSPGRRAARRGAARLRRPHRPSPPARRGAAGPRRVRSNLLPPPSASSRHRALRGAAEPHRTLRTARRRHVRQGPHACACPFKARHPCGSSSFRADQLPLD